MDFPSNSKSSQGKDEKKIESVVKNRVSTRKKPLGKRFMETFIAGNPKQVAEYVFFEVMLPAAKDMISDAFSQAVDKYLYPDGRSPSRRGSRPGLGGFVSYNRFSQPSSPLRREEERRPSRSSHGVHNFEEIVLETRPEAEAVTDGLFEIVSKYGQTSVADLCELVGITADPVAHKWGWTDLQGMGIRRISNGYLLDMPKPDPL